MNAAQISHDVAGVPGFLGVRFVVDVDDQAVSDDCPDCLCCSAEDCGYRRCRGLGSCPCTED